jgi:hypothetical protein
MNARDATSNKTPHWPAPPTQQKCKKEKVSKNMSKWKVSKSKWKRRGIPFPGLNTCSKKPSFPYPILLPAKQTTFTLPLGNISSQKNISSHFHNGYHSSHFHLRFHSAQSHPSLHAMLHCFTSFLSFYLFFFAFSFTLPTFLFFATRSKKVI